MEKNYRKKKIYDIWKRKGISNTATKREQKSKKILITSSVGFWENKNTIKIMKKDSKEFKNKKVFRRNKQRKILDKRKVRLVRKKD